MAVKTRSIKPGFVLQLWCTVVMKFRRPMILGALTAINCVMGVVSFACLGAISFFLDQPLVIFIAWLTTMFTLYFGNRASERLSCHYQAAQTEGYSQQRDS